MGHRRHRIQRRHPGRHPHTHGRPGNPRRTHRPPVEEFRPQPIRGPGFCRRTRRLHLGNRRRRPGGRHARFERSHRIGLRPALRATGRLHLLASAALPRRHAMALRRRGARVHGVRRAASTNPTPRRLLHRFSTYRRTQSRPAEVRPRPRPAAGRDGTKTRRFPFCLLPGPKLFRSRRFRQRPQVVPTPLGNGRLGRRGLLLDVPGGRVHAETRRPLASNAGCAVAGLGVSTHPRRGAQYDRAALPNDGALSPRPSLRHPRRGDPDSRRRIIRVFRCVHLGGDRRAGGVRITVGPASRGLRAVPPFAHPQ